LLRKEITTSDIWKTNVENVIDYLKRSYPEPNYKVLEPVRVDKRKVPIFVVEDEDGYVVRNPELSNDQRELGVLSEETIKLILHNRGYPEFKLKSVRTSSTKKK